MKNKFKKEIVFTNIFGYDTYPPKPAKDEIPKWYKNTLPYIGDGKKILNKNQTPGTIKKCMPIFDAITCGYILYTQADVYVSQKDGKPYYNWSSQDAVNFHPSIQLLEYPKKITESVPKWNNPYIIKTPIGYSSLFVPPMHSPNNIFTILEGLVDTDTFTAPVELPFTLNDDNWEGLIPAGTPMAQVIPIKRDMWEHKFGSDNEIKEKDLVQAKIRSLFVNKYKTFFWHKKQYN